MSIETDAFQWLRSAKNCTWVLPNVYLYPPWEDDVIGVTRSRFIHVIEVKRSRHDWEADFRKTGYTAGVLKHDCIAAGKCSNYFWFACPDGMLKAEDMPEHTGLLVWRRGRLWVKKEARRLHTRKIEAVRVVKLSQKSTYRYWAMRKRLEEVNEEHHLSLSA